MSDTPVADLLARASSRIVVLPGDARSTSLFEQVEIGGERYFLKRLSPATDWIMRITGDHIHRPYQIWRAGIMDAVPPCIDHTVVAMQVDGEGDTAELSVLMRDVGNHLVPEGDEPVSLDQHARFIAHLAELSATFWDWEDTSGLTTMAQRLRFFAPRTIAPELRADVVPGPITAADTGWATLPRRSPLLDRVARTVHASPTVLTDPLSALPHTFLHGDWKMGNLGSHPDGRTILLDWAYPGAGPVCWDLCWYMALNQARLPETKEATTERLRKALEANGIATEGWWDAQLDLCTVAIMATFAWEKALGDDDELQWWEQRVASAVQRRRLTIVGSPV
jgi:hypothetical protein